MQLIPSLRPRVATLAAALLCASPLLHASGVDDGDGTGETGMCPVAIEDDPFPAITLDRGVAGFTDGGYNRTDLQLPGPVPLGVFATDVDSALVFCDGSCVRVFYGVKENARWTVSAPSGSPGVFLDVAANEVSTVPDHMRVLFLPPSDLANGQTRICTVRATAYSECGPADPDVYVEFEVKVTRLATGLFDVNVTIGQPSTVDLDPKPCEENPDAFCDLLMSLQLPPPPSVTISSYPSTGMLVSEYRPLNCVPDDFDRLVFECGTPPGTEPVIHNGGQRLLCDDIKYAWSIVGAPGNTGQGHFLSPDSRSPLFYAKKSGLITVRVDIDAGGELAFHEVTFEIFKPRLKQMAFDTPIKIQRDSPIQDYGPPHWKDVNDNGSAFDSGDHRFPVAFSVGQVLKVKDLALTAQVKPMPGLQLMGADHNYTETYFANSLQYQAGGTGNWTCASVTTIGTPHHLAGYFPFRIEWYSGFAGSSLQESLGTTDNRLYFIFGTPSTNGAGRLHTTFEVACKLNDGAPDPTTCLNRMWTLFQSRAITKPTPDGFNNAVTQTPLKYWGNPNTVTSNPQTLVVTGDGSCGAWSRFMLACLALQGVASNTVKVTPLGAPANSALYVHNWQVGGPPPFLASLYKPFGVNDLAGIVAQNNPNPMARFGDHSILRVGASIYDPSYGVGPYNGWPSAAQIAWEQAGLFGWSLNVTSTTPNLDVNTTSVDLQYQ